MIRQFGVTESLAGFEKLRIYMGITWSDLNSDGILVAN